MRSQLETNNPDIPRCLWWVQILFVLKFLSNFVLNKKPPWRIWLARSAVNRKVGGSSPPGGVNFFFKFIFYCRKPKFVFPACSQQGFLGWQFLLPILLQSPASFVNSKSCLNHPTKILIPVDPFIFHPIQRYHCLFNLICKKVLTGFLLVKLV